MAKRTKKLLQFDDSVEIGDYSVRLNRFLSDSGACSRREADKLISINRKPHDKSRIRSTKRTSKNEA